MTEKLFVLDETRRLAWPHDRRGLGTAALALVFVAHASRYWMHVHQPEAAGDGFYSWIFARSMAFDLDLNLRNDYALCGDPFKVGTIEAGYGPGNPFYFGPALYLAPVLWVLRHVIKLPADAPASAVNGCSGPFLFWTGMVSVIAVTATIFFAYRIARRWFSETAAAFGALVVGFASPLNVFGSLSWYYSHLWAALSIAIAMLCALRAVERPEDRKRWAFTGAAVGLAALMRPQEAIFGLTAAGAVLASVRGMPDRAAAARAFAIRGALTLVPFLAVSSIQLFVWKHLYGSPWVLPQGKLYLQLGHAHPWLLLFSARAGLLYWTPLMWLAVLGLVPLARVKEHRIFAIGIVVASVVDHYVASAALTWSGGATLGARIDTSLAPVFLVATAALLDAALRALAVRRVGAATVAFFVLLPWIAITWEIGRAGLPNNKAVPAPKLYAEGVRSLFDGPYGTLGNPFTLPASLVFAARYGTKPRVFDAVSTDGMFIKHYKTLELVSGDVLDFANPPDAFWSEGTSPLGDAAKPEGVKIEGGRMRFLVALYWPWITKVKIKARGLSGGNVTLHVVVRGFVHETDLGRETFPAHDTDRFFSAPPDAFDSGINEVVIEADGDAALGTWTWMDESKHDTGIHY